MTEQRRDRGYTLIELLLVIVVLAILATVVVASVGGFTADAEESSCRADAQVLYMATEAFFAQYDTTLITPDGTSADRYELQLANLDLLHRPSTLYDLDAYGQVVQAPGSPCAVPTSP